MLEIYDLGMRMGRRALLTIAGTVRGEKPSKFIRFARGQKQALREAESILGNLDKYADRKSVV